MKLLIPILFFIATVSPFGNAKNDVQWLLDYNQAKKTAKKEHKNMLMYFTGSDWCAPCKMLKEDFFETDRFKELSKNYVLVKVDIPRRIDVISPEQMDKNKDLLNRFNDKKVFPKIIFFNHRGKKIDEIEGYNSLRDPHIYFEKLEENQK